MPPRLAPRRQVGRRVKEEPTDEAPSNVPEDPGIAQESTSGPLKTDNESGSQDLTSIENLAEQTTGLEENPSSSVGGVDNTTPQQQSTTLQAQTRGAQPAKRFQTRAGIVRKSEADRRRLEQEEEQRRQRRLNEATRGQRGSRRARGDRGAIRGRGGAAAPKGGEAVGTSWAFERASETPRPSFGGERVVSGASGGDSGQASGSTGGTYVGSGSTSGRGRAGAGASKAAADNDFEEEEEDVERTDIDHINLSSDEEDEDAIPAKGRKRHTPQEGGLRPIRLEKHEHVKRAVGIEATKLKAEQNIKQEANEKSEVLRKAAEITVAEAEDTMQLDHLATQSATPKKEVEMKAPLSPEERRIKQERRRRTSSKDHRLLHETVEEQQERIRYENDLRKISRALGGLGEDAIDDVDEEDFTTALGNGSARGRDGKLYLIQLPPMTPVLRAPGEAIDEAQDGGAVKDTTMTTTSGRDAGTEPKIKKEAGTEAAETPPSIMNKQILTAGDDRLPGGFVGKLNVHQSGKVTLDWGGTSMVVNWGTEVDFLQDAVLAVPSPGVPDVSDKRESKDPGMAYSLAPVRNKLVVTPDWQKIYE
ncbi:putative dna-directed rna polymerase iii [Phaeomoniella chlamydospora]|uniref:Putative dna-directed rna polymerase iii n=1 Tax=Phaeomoniella chlamydospora TaxID=158046 RepID=A0A0G2FUM2_PHACM|nr:putative dna-directed rna polymerase iii [Phaeomoniella chlamydospora]